MGSKETILPPHVLIFPLPILGHVNSMLRLAELLCLAGLDITFIVSEFAYSRLIKHTDIVDTHSARYPGFQFQTVPDGLPDEHPRAGERVLDIMPGIREVTAPFFLQMMVENNCFARDRSRRPITCIVADGFLSFVGDFAESRGIPIVYFRTSSACSFWAYFCIPELIQAGDIPVKGNGMDLPVKSVPGMETFLRRRDLPGFCRVNDIDEPKLRFISTETTQTTRAQALILNTFEDLEGSILSQIRKHMPRLFTIGPNHYLLRSKLESEFKSKGTELGSNTISSGSFWKEDRRCMNWLDSQPEKSVLYVSFGSITVVTRVQILEFWHGLVNSGQRFLWVVRPDSVTGKINEEVEEEQILQIPAAEMGEIEKGRGYTVSWASQQEVLNHSAIAGFLTHGGWNSILESIVAGVPMICWPYFGDQIINSRFVSHVWKIGLDMKDTCDRNTIEKMVKELMEVRRDEFVERINRMAGLARNAVTEGGPSCSNLDGMVEYFHSLIV